jgi:hypothetical protein
MTDGTEIFKWLVDQTYYSSGQRRVRVAAVSRGTYEGILKDFGEETPCESLLVEGEHAQRAYDFFDGEGEAREFAERCWRQG